MRASSSTGMLQPLADRQRHGVQPEVVAELVGQHAAQLVAGQRLDRVRRDHHQVAAARERVQLVRRQHGQHVPAPGQVVGLQHRPPRRCQHRPFVVRSAAGRPAAARARRPAPGAGTTAPPRRGSRRRTTGTARAHTRCTGHQNTRIASSHTGTTATTGAIAVMADESRFRRAPRCRRMVSTQPTIRAKPLLTGRERVVTRIFAIPLARTADN